MRHYWMFLILLVCLMFATPALARQESGSDAIPSNCEYTGEYSNPNWFMRYAYNEGRIVLMDWSSGEVVRVLEPDVTAAQVLFVNWSPNCRYIVGAIGDGLWFTTYIWDATDGTRIGTVENGYQTAHQVTWSPRSDQVVVETRRGAFLWTLATGERVQLTADSYLSESFLDILWNYDAGVIETRTIIGASIHFDLATGEVRDTSFSNSAPRPNTVVSAYSSENFGRWIVQPGDTLPYGCVYPSITVNRITYASLPNLSIWVGTAQIAIVDRDTNEIVHVIAANLQDFPRVPNTYRLLTNDCEHLFTLHYTNANRAIPRTGIVWRLSDDSRAHVVEGIPSVRWIGYSNALPRYEWDPNGRYLFVQTYNGAQIWDSDTGRVIWLSTAGESARNGYSVESPQWDLANGRVTIEMLYLDETRTFDLNTGERVS